MKGFKFKSIAITIFVAFAAIMIAFAGILYFVVQSSATAMNERSADANLRRQAALIKEMLNNRYEGDWTLQEGVLFKGGNQMNDDFDFPDQLLESTGINFTLFAGDTRITTNVLGLDGARAVGTQVSDEIAAEVLEAGETYIGYADVVGTPNYTYYEPLYNTGGEIVGMFFIGLPANQIVKDLQRMTGIVLAAVLFAAIIASVVSYIIVRRIGNQVRLAADTASKLALGDAELEIPSDSQARADEIGTLMRSMQELVGSQQAMAKTALEVSRGNLTTEVFSRSDKDILASSMQSMLANLRRMADSVKQLTVEAAAGNLKTRGDAQAFEGGYREIVSGVNATLDAVTAPLMEADHVLGRLAVSDATVAMSEDYNGDFKKLAVQINQVRDMFGQTESVCVNVAAGDFTLYPALVEAAKDADENNQLLPAMISMMESVKSMSESAGDLAAAAGRGDLDYRADASAFSGAYAEVVENLNQALEAMAAPLGEMQQVLAKIADGNLTVRMTGLYQGSYDEIKQSINRMTASLLQTMESIMQASEQVAASANEISNASGALSQGSTEQASSIEELSASITEVASQTRQNAGNATSANDISQRAHTSADIGSRQMSEMVEAMNEINTVSANIAKIIKVIDDIAFQTNILALNAAVEAARAGQHGKGFAVVAEEVRNLAARSAEAARETTQYIETTLEKVDSGSKIAHETESSLQDIVAAINQTAVLVADIANASNEQASGIAQINQGIDQVSVVVQNNSATAEETASTSELLSEQAKLLHETISSFRLS